MAFCLPKEFVDKFLQALKDGVIVPEKLIEMTSEERRNFFKDIVGETDAKEVNALLESKLLLQDQKRGMVTWAKQIAGISEPVRRDIISRIEKMDKILNPEDDQKFLEDLAAKKLGTDVSFEEAKYITESSKALAESKNAIPLDSPIGSKERLNYGLKYTLFQDYIKELKGNDKVIFKEWIVSPSKIFDTIAGNTKSLLSTLDNSFFGRQGIKMLYTHPTIWGNAFIKSWGDIGKEFAGIDAMVPIKADIYSRPNALNGKYRAGGYDIGIDSEEAFPSSLPEKIPLLGRIFRGAESAFNGAALRMRADYADKLIARADEFGVNTLDPREARGLGSLTNSMTGRGRTGGTPGQQRFVNVTLFSAKFLKSNFDTLTAHLFDKTANNFVKKEAATNLAKIIAVEAAIMFTANQLSPGSAEIDPRGAGFGKIRHKDTTFDITGGMGSLVHLAAQLVPTIHEGKWGFWSKNSKTGKWTDLTAGKYGQQNVVDIMERFVEGKLSPVAGLVRDVWKGKNFQGQKITPLNEAANVVTPLSIQNFQELTQNPNSAPLVASMILDGLGISVYTPPPKKK